MRVASSRGARLDAARTIRARAEVRGPGGQLAVGAIVRFQAQPSADSTRRTEPTIFVCALAAQNCGPISGTAFAVDTTDSQGRAKALVRLGHVAGRAVIRMHVPEFGLLDSATYTVNAGAVARVRATVADTALDVGQTATLRGRVVDRYGNARPELPFLTVGTGTSISVVQATGVVTAAGMGTQTLYARFLTFVDSTIVRVLPAGRLVVWSSSARSVRLVNINGTNVRTLVSGVSSDYGAFPRFDATRQRVTLHGPAVGTSGSPNSVIDTTGSPRRDINGANGFTEATSVRQVADGTVYVVGRRAGGSYSVWRVALDGAVTLAAALPGYPSDDAVKYGGADVSPDGTRVAYIGQNAVGGYELRVFTIATGAFTVLDPNARAPRWSAQGDRLAYNSNLIGAFDGSATVINADGTNRRVLTTGTFSPGLAWSPDGLYVIGRSSSTAAALRLVRVSDGVSVFLTLRSPTGSVEDYFQPDWR